MIAPASSDSVSESGAIIGRTDKPVKRSIWSPKRWPIAIRVAVATAAIAALAAPFFSITGSSALTSRVPMQQLTIGVAERGVFHDLIPLRAIVAPRDKVYVDAIDGGQIAKVLVEPGDFVEEGQPLVELTNTNFALQVIQQESQLNQAISQLQQNEISLEQEQLSNARALAQIDYNLVRLGRSSNRREGLASKGLVSAEDRDIVADELAYYRQLKPIQLESSHRQTELYDRLLPDIHQQLRVLRGNLVVVHDKLDALVVRSPVAGKVTVIDLKVGETRSSGQRLAEVTPQTGMKLVADVDEFYLPRVRAGQLATIDINGTPVDASVARVSPQVRNGQFEIDLDFATGMPPALVEGAATQGKLQLGGDSDALILKAGAFLESTGGQWAFVIARDGDSAERRRVSLGRRTTEQLEVLAGLAPGERVVTSDYSGFERANRLVLVH